MDQRVDVTVEDPRIAVIADQLMALPMPTITGRTFASGRVYLDGRRFRNCTFMPGCELVIRTGSFELENCDLVAGFRIATQSPVAHAVEVVLRATGHDEGQGARA